MTARSTPLGTCSSVWYAVVRKISRKAIGKTACTACGSFVLSARLAVSTPNVTMPNSAPIRRISRAPAKPLAICEPSASASSNTAPACTNSRTPSASRRPAMIAPIDTGIVSSLCR
jgi:hypothetical protein